MRRDVKVQPEDVVTDAGTPQAWAKAATEAGSPQARVLEELYRDLERSVEPDPGAAWPPLLEEPRRRVDSRYAPPATSHRPVVGPALVLAKRGFRLAFQPFINEVLRRQVEFNEAILASLAGIYEQVRVSARTQALWREEVASRLEKLEAAARKKKGPKKG